MKISPSVALSAALLTLIPVMACGCSLGGGTDASVANDIRSETMSNKTSGPPVSPDQAQKANKQGASIPATKP